MLPIERGRYIGLERGMRLCEICDLEDLGDEYHYIRVRKNKNITTLRESILPRYYWQRPSMFKFTQMLSSVSENIRLARKVSSLCRQIMYLL